jgi:predicted permease
VSAVDTMTRHARDLKLRIRALLHPKRVERELDDELAFHLERETQELIARGISPDDARIRARARFGATTVAADECRDARGTAFVDSTVRDVHYALRTFRRAPLAAVTIVSTVALGLGLITVVFSVLNLVIFRVDNVPNPHEMFTVRRPPHPGSDAWVSFTRPDYERLRAETSVFTDVFAMLPDVDSRIDGRLMGGTLVSGNFFQVVGVNAALGRPLMPPDDARSGAQPVMVLSHKGWSRLFASDPQIVGRRLLVNGTEHEIVGVMPEGFRGLLISAPDYWAPLSQLGQFRRIHAGREDSVAIEVGGRLKPGISRQAALASLGAWAAQHPAGNDPRRTHVRLIRRDGTVPDDLADVLLVFSPIFFAFGLILMIGCANVANLLLARGVSRQREIGIRLSLGASRRRIVRQLLTESLLLALAAAAGGYVVSRVAIETTIYIVTTTMPAEIAEMVRLSAPAGDWRVILFLLGGAVAATVFFGLVPALQATRVELVRTMRGEVTRDAKPGRARNALIALQVGASALLLVCASIFLRSAAASAAVDPGFRTTDTVIIEINNEPKRVAMLQAVRAEPLVGTIAASWPGALSASRAATAASETVKTSAAYRFVSAEYFSVLDIPVLRGRAFTAAEAAGRAPVAVISETTARQLWPNADPLGQTLHLDADPGVRRGPEEPPLPARALTVVGVFRDVTGFRLAEKKEAGIYVPIAPGHAEADLTVRVYGDPVVARRKLLERLTVVDPNMGMIMIIRTLAQMETYLLAGAFWLTFVLGALALVLTLSGLFSVLSYLVEQRAKEIGVRMALGATAASVVRLVVSQLVRPVGIGLLAGIGLAGTVASLLLLTDAAEQVGSTVKIFDPLAYGSGILFIVAACATAASIPALRAGRIDPMTTLRQD